MFTEADTIELGMYCQTLMEDANFSNLVKVCEAQFALDVLNTEDEKERTRVYNTYQGLKSLLETMQQFVIAKDQIVARNEKEETKD